MHAAEVCSSLIEKSRHRHFSMAEPTPNLQQHPRFLRCHSRKSCDISLVSGKRTSALPPHDIAQNKAGTQVQHVPNRLLPLSNLPPSLAFTGPTLRSGFRSLQLLRLCGPGRHQSEPATTASRARNRKAALMSTVRLSRQIQPRPNAHCTQHQ